MLQFYHKKGHFVRIYQHTTEHVTSLPPSLPSSIPPSLSLSLSSPSDPSVQLLLGTTGGVEHLALSDDPKAAVSRRYTLMNRGNVQEPLHGQVQLCPEKTNTHTHTQPSRSHSTGTNIIATHNMTSHTQYDIMTLCSFN